MELAAIKVHMKWKIFSHNFTLQYVNKLTVNIKVFQNKNLAAILSLKSAQFSSKNGQETGTSLLRNFILWRSVVDRICLRFDR